MSESELASGNVESGSGPPLTRVSDSLHVSTSPQARAKRRIATLMEEVENLKQDRAIKQRYALIRTLETVLIDRYRKTTYYVSQGRAIRRLVALYTPTEDLIAENDRRCETHDRDFNTTQE
jgi:hypothetical protein